MYYFEINKFVRGHVLFREGEAAEYIYVVKSGDFAMTKNFEIKRVINPFTAAV
jgi:CRP-like cAMP-binding protein